MKKYLTIFIIILLTLFFAGCTESKVEEYINVEKTSYEIEKGQSEEIKYTVNKEEETTVVIESLDPKIVKVEGNTMYALNTGKTQIEIYLSSVKLKKIIDVTVVDRIAQNLSTSITEYEVGVGETKEIDLLVEKNEETELIINSLNPNVCKIENTSLVGVKEGITKVEIFLSTNPQNKIILSVTVKNEVVKPKIDVLKKEYFMLVDDEQIIEGIQIPNEEKNNLVIKSLNEDIATVKDGIIFALKEGNAHIKLYLSTDENNYVIINVIVKKDEVKIMNKKSEIGIFGSITLIGYTNNENDKLYWSSNSENVTIDNTGYLLATNLGKATITLTNEKGTTDTMEINVIIDPITIFDSLHINNVLVKDVTTYGENPKTRVQTVLGSVSLYSFKNLNIIEEIVPVDTNKFTGQVATKAMLAEAEPLKLVRPGILLEELKYIIYHDTGNANEGANAKNHAEYMVSQYNRTARARSWHYTVADDVIYHHIPTNEVTWQGDSYEAYAKSIGIETCIDYGSDLYKTWQNMAKLLAKLLKENNLNINSIKQHYDMSGKNCPQTLRSNNLYDYAIDLVKGEYQVLSYLNDCKITFESLCPEFLDNTGKVIAQPKNDTVISYMLTTEYKGVKSSKVYFSTLKGSMSEIILSTDEELIRKANDFDRKAVLSLNNKTYDITSINALLSEYEVLDDDVKKLVSSLNYINKKEYELLVKSMVNSSIVINRVYSRNKDINNTYNFIELKNISENKINLLGINIYINDEIVYTFDNKIMYPSEKIVIAFGSIKKTEGSKYIFSLPDIVLKHELNESDFSISVRDGEKLYDNVGLNNSSSFEKESIDFKALDYYIERKQNIDTDNNNVDFKAGNISNQFIECLSFDAYMFDYEVLAISNNVTLEDEERIKGLNEIYQAFSNENKELVSKKELLDEINIKLEGIKNPSALIVNNAIGQIPNRIVNDYLFPQYDGLTYRYASGEDISYYNIDTGKYLKLSLEYNPITIVATHLDYSKSFVVNFGIAEKGDKIIYNTGSAEPSGGITANGFGTYQNQLSTIGFGTVAIRVNNNIYIIGKNALINLKPTSLGNTLSRKDLRPLGGNSILNNYGIIDGVATEYKGSGALYYNSSNQNLKFDLNDTYGRNNSGAYGYYKIIFGFDENHDYYVKEILPNTGSNETVNPYSVTLKPGEYLWCPHTYETNVTGGTWLMNHGASASGGVLNLNVRLEIINFKAFN